MTSEVSLYTADVPGVQHPPPREWATTLDVINYQVSISEAAECNNTKEAKAVGGPNNPEESQVAGVHIFVISVHIFVCVH